MSKSSLSNVPYRLQMTSTSHLFPVKNSWQPKMPPSFKTMFYVVPNKVTSPAPTMKILQSKVFFQIIL